MTVRYSDVAQHVTRALQDDPRLDRAAIDVVDEGGMVTLTGTVPSKEAHRAAIEITEQQEGVVEIVDELKIEAAQDGGIVVVAAPPAQAIHGAYVSRLPEDERREES